MMECVVACGIVCIVVRDFGKWCVVLVCGVVCENSM